MKPIDPIAELEKTENSLLAEAIKENDPGKRQAILARYEAAKCQRHSRILTLPKREVLNRLTGRNRFIREVAAGLLARATERELERVSDHA